jgi:ribosomal protein S18 acetylase RimI-like enzyme
VEDADAQRESPVRGFDRAAVRSLEATASEAAVRVLALAFRDNPLNRAVIGPGKARREKVNAAGLRPQLPAAVESGCALAAYSSRDALLGVLLATAPGSHALALPTWPVRLRALAGQGWRVARRWGEVQDLLLVHRPPAPHWYLALLGVDPSGQRTGVGSALLAAFLDEVDRSGGLPVWLETDRLENVAFYRRAGFRNVGELRVFGVPVWLLQRPAREL